jgi:hypothetical protein
MICSLIEPKQSFKTHRTLTITHTHKHTRTHICFLETLWILHVPFLIYVKEKIIDLRRINGLNNLRFKNYPTWKFILMFLLVSWLSLIKFKTVFISCEYLIETTATIYWEHEKKARYTGCPRRNVPDFGRVFLMLKYTDITQNTYVQSWMVTEIMAREKCGPLAGVTAVKVSNFSGHNLRNRSTLDIGVLGYIGIL